MAQQERASVNLQFPTNSVKLVSVAIVLGLVSFAPALGQAAKEDCFQIVSPIPGNAQANLIMLNRCSGASWMLVRSPTVSKTNPLDFTYRWMPLSVGQREPEFTRSPP
jgi:hypothetical protein